MSVEPFPVECAPFRDSASSVMQRLDCRRRNECLTAAVLRKYLAFTCIYCSVRETGKRDEFATHIGSDEYAALPVTLDAVRWRTR